MDESVHVHDILNSGFPRIKFLIIIDHHNGSISIGGVDQFGDWQFFKSIVRQIIFGKFDGLQSGIHGSKPVAPEFGGPWIPAGNVDKLLIATLMSIGRGWFRI